VELDGNSILASMLVGSIGFVAFVYGKRQGRLPQMVVGVILCIFPYFVTNILAMFAITAALLFALWGVVKLGW
jgi:hypothetical protein